jgi:hypothetical protein
MRWHTARRNIRAEAVLSPESTKFFIGQDCCDGGVLEKAVAEGEKAWHGCDH